MTPGSQALDYSQDVATQDEVLEQEALEEAEQERTGSAPAATEAETEAEEPRRRPVTAPQIAGGILIAAIVVAAAVWYVPRIVKADNRSFTGSVSSSGVTNLNFANSGLVGRVAIHLGQAVKAGQILATETSPSTTAAISADRASIAAGKASLAELKVSGTQASIAAAGAQLAQDQAQLASDKVKLAETQIIAPEAGTVIAINGQTGETVTAAGIRSYSSQSQTSGSQSPPFSLLPEGPAANVKSSTTQSALPMMALRTSSSWQVTVLVPESEIQQVHGGQAVTVAVPAVGLRGVRGTVQQVSPTPVSTSIGTAYQAIVRISGHQRVTPLGGMTANVQLAS
jgi:multidrug efflux pump subunit AcrA (membrane-fusion protein)